jgi:hypothetical protein
MAARAHPTEETTMHITRGFRQLVDEANARIRTYSVQDVRPAAR